MRVTTLVVLLASGVLAGEMPSGQGSAEGAAASYHQALAQNNARAYRQLQNPKLLKNAELAKHVSLTERRMSPAGRDIIGAHRDIPAGTPSRPGVQAVSRAGAISSTTALETARKEFGFRAIGFVDVDVLLVRTGPGSKMGPEPRSSRTFVVQDANGKWYVLPRPDLFPKLTQGWASEEATGEVIWRRKQGPAHPPALKDLKR